MGSSALRVSVGVSIPHDMLAEIDEHADSEDTNRSEFIRTAVRQYINDSESESE